MKINNAITKEGHKVRLWSEKSVMRKKGEIILKHWEKHRKYFYLYDENGEKIYESMKEFSNCNKSKGIIDVSHRM